MSQPREDCKLILALDVPTREEAFAMLERCGSELRWVKVGLQLFVKYGPDFVKEIADKGYAVFLDLKLHDIPNTVASAVRSLKGLPIGMLTLHSMGGQEMMTRAAEAAAEINPELTLLGVTVLTSMNRTNLATIGFDDDPEAMVLRLARLTAESGLGGLVCSPLELPLVRKELGPKLAIITPGVRPEGASADDQKRTLTPAGAREKGSSFIVVGRPILKAEDPSQAIRRILAELR
ncbi:orotidine-5'-phosphate decarboxylase [Ruficoccus amylovorans]|uniref:Orotidine 5'-phosphate decarboxylase n=1 Tax=Ruficoccus amylovorans TaxID=1804625 RepID=A0A842HB79_9BACT|nr:orotidine-5'-phosphate decarboxylase [Ruficoccus amylovorans]MBC2593655.1 orotidine-5'-phosphate decarboxylase [Ruficoccus amylovorans]